MKKDFIVLIIVSSIVFLLGCDNGNSEKIYSRYEAAEYIKPKIHKVAVEYKQYFNAPIREVELVIALLAISETSYKDRKGIYRPFLSPLYKVNNLFGIKADKTKIKNGEYVSKQTWEEYNGNNKVIKDRFATFKSKEKCIRYWFEMITTNKRYKKVLEANNYAEILIQLQVCGYMTDSKYPQKMLNVAKEENLELLFGF
jgi:hypothetical protein